MSHPPLSKEPTVGEIARRLNEPLQRSADVVRSRGIQPARTAGNLGIFSEDHVAQSTAGLRLLGAWLLEWLEAGGFPPRWATSRSPGKPRSGSEPLPRGES